MGHTSTTSRTFPRTPLRYSSRTAGSNITSGSSSKEINCGTVPKQSTNSYRSRSRSEDPYADSLVSSSSYLDSLKNLANEDRETRHGYDSGHGFWTFRETFVPPKPISYSGALVNPVFANGYYKGYPYLYSSFGNVDNTFSSASAPSDMDSRGTIAIRKTAPTAPSENLGVALAEFYREGLPRLAGVNSLESILKQRPSLKDAADDYLAWEFGYKPLANDIAGALAAVTESHKVLSQYIRDSGRVVRRKHSFPTVETITSSSLAGVQIGLTGLPTGSNGSERFFAGANSSATATQTIHTKKTYWFSGAYTYMIPQGNPLSKWASLVQHSTGLALTPEVLWNLAPWSWLSDWVFDLGDVLSNVSYFSTDSLVMRYGYMMCTTEVVRTITHPGKSFANGSYSGPVSVSWKTTRKDRTKATPYGFGLNPTGFSSKQWSILAALGISKAPANVLR